MKPTDVSQLVTDLGTGVFQDKLSVILSQVASSVLEFGRGGEVTVKLKMKPAGSANQLTIEHILAYKQPKKRGNISEDDAQETILYVNDGGNLSQFPENQIDMFHNTPVKASDDAS